MDSIRLQLKEMGFSDYKINKALEACPKAETLEAVMEWVIAHSDELNEPVTSDTSASNSNTDDFRQDESAADAAARRKITVEEAQALIVERAKQRAEEERKKAIEDEKKRRLDGQKMAETRASLQDQERINLAQQIRREKIEKELHRKRLLEQIALDRANMKAKSNPVESTPKPATSSSSNITKTTNSNLSECKIALRFPDGSSKVQLFSPQETLAAVRLFVQLERNPDQSMSIGFVQPPNKKLDDSMMDEKLENLGLCPASRLEVKYTSKWEDLD